MRKFLDFIILVLVGFLIVKISTFGWRLGGKAMMSVKEDKNQLAKKLQHHVYTFSHIIGERSIFKHKELNKAAEYISEQLELFGYTVEFQDYTVYGAHSKNIIATKRGAQRPDEVIIVGAHYDSCYNPGADDNASGLAGLLELARFVSEKQNGRTIKFIAFVNEEPPFFHTENMGSRVYAKAARKKGEDIKAVLIMEMIGYYTDEPNSQRYPPFFGLFYPNRGNFICIVGNFSSGWLAKKVVTDFKKSTDFPIESFIGPGSVPGVDFSDHWSFWKEGYPAVMITDTSFYRTPHYHSESDTFEKLDYERMAEVVRGLGSVLIECAR